ncbi:hypothetical protein BH11GEM2_BH11GEM2_06910 [soil metagenome]
MHTSAALARPTARIATGTYGLALDAAVFLLTVGFIYSTRFRAIAPLHTGHVAVLILFAGFGARYGRIHLPVSIVAFALFAASIAIYSTIVATYYGHEPVAFVTICLSMVVYVAFGFHLAAFALRRGITREQLATYLLLMIVAGIVLNSTLCLAEALSRPLKQAVESAIIDDSPFPYAMHPFKVRGLVAGAGAALSVGNAIAILMVIQLTWRGQVNMLVGSASSATILISTIFIGRTGLLIGIPLFVIQIGLVVYMGRRDSRSRAIALLTLAACAAAVYYVTTKVTLDAEVGRWAFEWYDALTEGSYSTSSTDDLQTMLYLTDDPMHLLLGVGLFEGASRVEVRTDSGYVRTILVLGLPLALLLYAVITGMMARIARAFPDTRPFVLLSILILFIVEVKEPFFYQNMVARMLFLLAGAAVAAGAPLRAAAAEEREVP